MCAAFDPTADAALAPKEGFALGASVQRLQDDFGLSLSAASPRFGAGHFAARLSIGPAWYPDLRALPEDDQDEVGGARALYWTGRLLLEASLPLAPAAGRLYAAVGPSVVVLPSTLSTDDWALGIYGVLGAELFAGDTLQAYPISLFFEVGASAHAAKADVAQRVSASAEVDQSVNRPIGTGLALSAGIRFYLGG